MDLANHTRIKPNGRKKKFTVYHADDMNTLLGETHILNSKIVRILKNIIIFNSLSACRI